MRSVSIAPAPGPSRAKLPAARQQSFDDLGLPLRDVVFCVIDLETTGASAKTCEITEVGAAKYQGGVCIGTFQTLINPGVPIPPEIIYLTGITETMVGPAPLIDPVLPMLLEFIGNAVIVGHNVRFDLSFLNKALTDRDYPKLANRVVDTCSLARRLVRSEVANCKLGTLSAHFGFSNQPTHRALDDVLATADLLHILLERAAGFGVLGLDDLLELPAINRHPHASKLHLTNGLPRQPGVYLFRDRSGQVLYVGKATNLRARVRSYFSTDERRKIMPLLQITARIDHVPCPTAFEAAVLEVRLIQRELPRFNRQSKFWSEYAYIRIVGSGPNPKITSVRTYDEPEVSKLNDSKLSSSKPNSFKPNSSKLNRSKPNGSEPNDSEQNDSEQNDQKQAAAARPPSDRRIVGPFSSMSAARMAARALQEAVELIGPSWPTILDADPGAFLQPLADHMKQLADAERFEDAAALRDRAGTLARAIDRQRKIAHLRTSGWTVLHLENRVLRLDHGRLRFGEGRAATGVLAHHDERLITRELVDELACVVRCIEKLGNRISIVESEHGLALPARKLPRFEPSAGLGDQFANASFDTRIKSSRTRRAEPSSMAASPRRTPSSRSRHKPATTRPAAAFSTTTSR